MLPFILGEYEMKIIIGLGNIGKEYEETRHNVGFMCVDYFIKEILKQDLNYKKKGQLLLYRNES